MRQIEENEIIIELLRLLQLGIPHLAIEFIHHQALSEEQLSRILSTIMSEIGDLWQKKEISLSQIVVAGMIAEGMVHEYSPIQSEQDTLGKPVVILGCISDDFHALGKDLVKKFLTSQFDVRDLGINVSPEKFVKEAQENFASVIAISAVMMNAVRNIDHVKNLIDEQEWTRRPLLVIGGAPFNIDPTLWERTGADLMISSAVEAPQKILEALKGRDLI